MAANKWLIFIIMGITLVYSLGQKDDFNKKRCIQFVTVILTCFSGFRSWQMGDVFHYCFSYIVCNKPGWQLDPESGDTIGLQLLLHGVGSLGLSFEICLFIIAAFVAITMGILIYRYSPSPYWSYVIYIAMGFYIFTFNGLKQTIAMAFLVLAMMQIIKRKPIRFVILVLIAVLFHYTALVFIIAYPFANKKIDRLYFVLVAAMFAIAFVFRNQIVQTVTQFYYSDEVSFEAANGVGGRFIVMILILVLALLLRPLKKYDTLYCQIFNVMVLACVLQIFSVYDNVFTRLADNYYQFVVLFIPMMLQPGWEQAEMYPEHKNEILSLSKTSYTMIGICITLFAIWFYFKNVNASADLLQGFHFFWQVDTPSSLELLRQSVSA